jgi:short-subunit dehydrogenase
MTAGPVLIVGGKSDVGLALAHRFAAAGHSVQLAARNADGLAADKADLELRHRVRVSLHELNILDWSAFEPFLDSLPALPEIAVCVVGLLGDQAQSQSDPELAVRIMRSNYEGPAVLTGMLANRFEARGSGTLIGLSSVAGQRGRASNYTYGSAKAGYTAFLSGLRNRLANRGVHVMTVLPGFMATRMTEGMDLPQRLTASAEAAAHAVFSAGKKRRDVIYIKPIWRMIMGIIGALPETIFKRTSL